MSKFLLNLLVEISKALINSKIQFLIQKFFFLAFSPADFAAHSAVSPAGPADPLPSQAETTLAIPPSPCVGRVFTEIRFPLWFASSELVASLSSLCQVGPGCQFRLPPPPADRLPRHLRPPRAARPQTSRCPARYSLHALIPLLNFTP
jgi:hypothetical protein